MSFLALLAAAPVPPPPPAPVEDPLKALYLLIGSLVVLQLIAMGFALVRWLASRTVEREDKDKEDLRSRLDEHDERFSKLERTLNDLDRLLGKVEQDSKSHHASVESIRGAISEIRGSIESSRDKQADYYRSQLKEAMVAVTEKIEKLEFDIRQDTTRAIHDAAAMQRAKKK
jgi:septation ring formation regulator EzrA